MPCSSFSQLQSLNKGTRTIQAPEGNDSLERERIGNKLADAVALLCEAQHSVGGFFSIENPKTSFAWLYHPIARLLDFSFDVVFDQCMFGLAPPNTTTQCHICKPTQPPHIPTQRGPATSGTSSQPTSTLCSCSSCLRIRKPTRSRTNLYSLQKLEHKCDGMHRHHPCYGSVKTSFDRTIARVMPMHAITLVFEFLKRIQIRATTSRFTNTKTRRTRTQSGSWLAGCSGRGRTPLCWNMWRLGWLANVALCCCVRRR